MEKTDTVDDFPEASEIWVSCKIEGSGTAWFDDLELVAYDRDDLPADFDSQHGKGNVAHRLVLDRWVGQWESTASHKTTGASARAGKTIGVTNSARILDGRLLQSLWTSKDGDEENLSFLAYDEESAVHRVWAFSSSGAAMEFAGQWDDATSTLTLHVVPTTPDVTGTSTTRFVDANTIESRVILKDKAGVVTRDVEETLIRKGETATSGSATSRKTTKTQQSQELIVLQRFIGSWQWQVVSRPADTSKSFALAFTDKVEWILRGRMIEHKMTWSPGNAHGLSLVTYDAEKREYREWHFESNGSIPRGENGGKWDESTQTLSLNGADPDGATTAQTLRFIDSDTIDWAMVSRDHTGEVVLKMDGRGKRR